MAERQETSVMASIQDILRDAQVREEEEKLEAERRARAEEERSRDELRRKQEEEEARIKAEDEARQRKVHDEQRRQAEIAAMQEATVARAKMEAEAQARLAEISARQAHERELHQIKTSKGHRTMKIVAVVLGVVFVLFAVGGGIMIKQSNDRAATAERQQRELQEQIDKAKQDQDRLKAELENTKDPEKIAALQAQIDEQKKKMDSLKSQQTGPKGPVWTGGPKPPGVGPGGAGGGGGNTKCNCSPGDPLCSCL
jgi:colicin import membrane protein